MSSNNTNKEYRVGQAAVGLTAVKIPASALADGNRKGILVKAYGSGDVVANTVPVFIGPAQVTVDSGFPLGPGESSVVPISGDDLYAIASAPAQKIAWILV